MREAVDRNVAELHTVDGADIRHDECPASFRPQQSSRTGGPDRRGSARHHSPSRRWGRATRPFFQVLPYGGREHKRPRPPPPAPPPPPRPSPPGPRAPTPPF